MDVEAWFHDCEDLAESTPNTMARGLQGSAILAIAAEVRALAATGAPVANFTVGDFSPRVFSVPPALVDGIKKQLDDGQTNYPPAVGVPELRSAIRSFYADRLGLSYPEGTIQAGSGARPPIFAAFACLVGPGDHVVYQIPSWNVGYYCHLNGATGIPVVTRPEDGFLLTAELLRPHLDKANLVVLNSPLNPSGTLLSAEELTAICEAILEENHRRRAAGERPVMLLWDQVYWQLTFDREHITPLHVAPEMARYTVMVDAVSKSWAATGVRVGWAACPPWVRARMKPFVGHMGAWAARAEQLAVAELLANPETVDDWMGDFKDDIQRRLDLLVEGIQALAGEGLPCDTLDAEGAIYLTARFALHGRRLDGVLLETDDQVRSAILQGAGVALVPFTAFGYPDGSGWFRFSVGAVSEDDVRGAIQRLGELMRRLD